MRHIPRPEHPLSNPTPIPPIRAPIASPPPPPISQDPQPPLLSRPQGPSLPQPVDRLHNLPRPNAPPWLLGNHIVEAPPECRVQQLRLILCLVVRPERAATAQRGASAVRTAGEDDQRRSWWGLLEEAGYASLGGEDVEVDGELAVGVGLGKRVEAREGGGAGVVEGGEGTED